MTFMVEFEKKEMLDRIDGSILAQQLIIENAKRVLEHLIAVREVFEPRSLERFHFSVRAENCLRNAGITTIPQLLSKSKQDLVDSKCVGVKSLAEIEAALKREGLSFRS